jgi:hypothetical protein
LVFAYENRRLSHRRTSQIGKSFGDSQSAKQPPVRRRQILATYFSSRKLLLLDQGDAPTSVSEQNCRCRSRGAAPNDDGVEAIHEISWLLSLARSLANRHRQELGL